MVDHDDAIRKIAVELNRTVRVIKAARFVCSKCGWLWAKVPECDAHDGGGIGDSCDRCFCTSTRTLRGRPVGRRSKYWASWIGHLASTLYWCGDTPWIVEGIRKGIVVRATAGVHPLAEVALGG